MSKCKDQYYPEPTVFRFDNAIIRVHRPILTDEERAKRMKAIEKSAIALLKDVMKHENH